MQETTVNGLFLRVSEWPLHNDRPTLVLLHGSGGTGVFWNNQIDAFTDVANVVAPDLPGHGESLGPNLGSIPEYAQAVADLIEAIGAPRPIPCGLSLGGGITLQLLLDHAPLLEAGILASTGARLRVLPYIFDAIETDFDAFVKAMPLMAVSPKTDHALLEPVQAATLANGPAISNADFRVCDVFDVMKRLHEIDLPVLVVTGTDDKLTPPKYGAFLAENISGAQRVSVEAAGHLAPAERPDVVNAAIREFVAGLG